jgi:hypothetical protein
MPETPKAHPMRFPTIALFAALFLSGCVHDIDKGLCPTAAALVGTSSLTVFKAGAGQDPSNEIYTVYLSDVRQKCDFDKDRNKTDSKVELLFRAKRPPSAEGVSYRFPYFVVVTHSGNIISKRMFFVNFTFQPGATSAAFEDTVDSTVIKMARKDKIGEYEILVGFQLTHDQLKYNDENHHYAQ